VGRIAAAGIEIGDFVLVTPIFVPDTDEVRAFAEKLHAQGKPWRGIAFGWAAHYEPASDEVPEGSKAKFDPASFCLGDANAWCYCLTWEDGDDQEPIEIITSNLLEN
jgi:hypothetical protein